MTEYGRGQGSEPWYPEDPVYGDQGWVQGGEADPYGAQAQQYPQQPYPQQQSPQPPQQYDAWGRPLGYDQQGYPQQGQHPQAAPQGYPQQQYGSEQYGSEQYGGEQYGSGQYPQQAPGQGQSQGQGQQQGYQGAPVQDPQGYQGAPAQDPQNYAGGPAQGADPQQYGGGQQSYGNGWDTGQQQVPYGADPLDPYGNQQAGYPAGQDPYANAGAYPPPEPPHRRTQAPEPEPSGGEWDPDPDEPEHPFFASDGDAGRAGGRRRGATAPGEDDDEDDYERADGDGGDRRGRRGGKPKKRRSGCACLIVSVVLLGGGGGIAYYGYQFYQDRFGPAPDYSGEGSGNVVVEIPDGATGIVMGNRLKEMGVVKSVDAFTSAQGDVEKGNSISPGFYTMRKGMSAKSAVELMLSPKSRNTLIVPEGYRNAWVYEQIDGRLGVKKGTTEEVAKKDWKKLGLPDWANKGADIKDPLEGFLYPSSYSVSKGQKPADVLKRMVAEADKQYAKVDLEGQAKKLKLKTPLELLTVASLVNAEGKTHDDFEKMAEVIYNRLKSSNTETNQLLQFDSTYNYLKGRSNIKISEKEILGNHDPYNTYTRKGLPPGPIGNPGAEALEASLKPTSDGWLYFVATDGMHKTEFAKTHADFLKLKEKFDVSSGG